MIAAKLLDRNRHDEFLQAGWGPNRTLITLLLSLRTYALVEIGD